MKKFIFNLSLCLLISSVSDAAEDSSHFLRPGPIWRNLSTIAKLNLQRPSRPSWMRESRAP